MSQQLTIDTTKGKIEFQKNLTLSTAWTSLETSTAGLSRFNVKAKQNVGLWLKGLLNDSDKVQIRLACFLTADPTETPFFTHIQTVGPTSVEFNKEVLSIAEDEIEFVAPLGVTDLVPYLEIQVNVGAVGITPAELTEAYVTFEEVS